MKYSLKKLLFIIICSLVVISCENKRKFIDTSGNITPEVAKEITIFGSENCDHCIAFREKMDSLNITYEFKDAEANEKFYKELMFKIQQANSKGNVSFPVLEVNDEIYVKPEFSEFMKILSE